MRDVGGSIHLESELDHGSCFMVVLPSSCLVAKSVGNHFDPCESLDFSNSPKEIFMVRPTSILLAEDNESNIETFASYLTAQGYQLYLAANGNQAIEIAQREKPNLILMDIQMPEMDGIQAISYLRQDPQLRNTPIIALTALAMAGDQERCLEVGANDYLSKPVKLKQLHQTIQYWLEHN